MYKNRDNGEGLLRGRFAQDRRLLAMAKLSAFGNRMNPMARNTNTNRNVSYSRSGQMQNNFGPIRSYHPQVPQIPAKSTRLNDQCFDFGQRNNYSTAYGHMNGTSKYSQSPHFSYRRDRGTARNAPYQVPVQNRVQEQGYFTRRTQENTQTRINGEPKSAPQNTWKHDNQSKTVPKAAPVNSAADISLKGVSDFLTPSPWFSGAKNFNSSYEKNVPENKLPSNYNVADSGEPYNKSDINGNAVGKPCSLSNTFHKKDDKVECLDNEYPEVIEVRKPATNKWVVPPELNKSIESGDFYAKVCEAVLEKVLQQLCPGSFKSYQKPSTKPINTQPVKNRTFNTEKKTFNGSSRYPYSGAADFTQNKSFQCSTPQQSTYNQCNRDYKKYAPKPFFYQPYRGRNVGKVVKRRIDTRNQESLV